MHRPGRVVCTLAAVVLAVIAIAVEEPVDFSGTWVLEKSERNTPPMVGDGFPGGGRGYPGAG